MYNCRALSEDLFNLALFSTLSWITGFLFAKVTSGSHDPELCSSADEAEPKIKDTQKKRKKLTKRVIIHYQ